MRITEIAPPGREKQVKALKKKFDDKGAPYAIAWAQHNKHGKPKKKESVDPLRSDMDAKKELAQEIYNNNKEYQAIYPTWKAFMVSDDFDEENDRLRSKFEGKMSDIDIDIKTMSDTEFEKKYGKSKAQMQKDLNEAFNSERDEVKAILDKYGIKNSDDIEYGSDVYMELYSYFADSGEMPYGVMKARDGDPDQWIADRIYDLGILDEQGPSDMGMNKYGLSATKFGDKFKSYQHGKLTGEFDSMEELQKHQLELIQDKPVDEAPFGAVKKAMNKAKRMVGKVPGLGSVGDQAQGEKDIGDRANALWKAFTKFKATDPDSQQQQAWFQKAGLDVVADGPNDKIDQNDVLQAIKTAKGAEDSGVAKTDTTQPDEMDKATLVQLQKIAPNADAKTMRAVNTMAQGQTISGDLQKSLRPVIQKIAVALQNPTQRQRLSKSLGESLSQTDLSKLDMLARQGMVPKNKVARFKTAMRTLAKGKDLPISYKDDVIDVVMKLSKIITKPSVMGMIRKGLRENQNPKSTFDKWVKKAKDKHNI